MVDVATGLTSEVVLSELMYADCLVMMTEIIVGLGNKC